MRAIPYLNTFVHGTYLVVVHAMGSMIGVNVMIVMAGGLAFVGREENSSDKIIMGTRLMNFSLWALWIILGGAGLMKGLLGVKEDYDNLMMDKKITIKGMGKDMPEERVVCSPP